MARPAATVVKKTKRPACQLSKQSLPPPSLLPIHICPAFFQHM